VRERFPSVDDFVDPTLHRNRVSFDDLDVPPLVRDMAEQVWQTLQPLADPDGDTAGTHAALDEARADYARLYREAEAIAQSSVTAAKPRKKQPAAAKKPAPQPPSLRGRIARRLPPPARRRVSRALRALRRS
jgi:hypothetical protein